MTTEIIQRPESSIAASDQIPVNSPMGMMMAAVKQGIALEQVEKMMDLQERWEQREAEKAFNDAMAAFKSEAVEIIKSKTVSYNSTSYAHEELYDIVEAVGPALSKHGFAWGWKTEQEGGQIRVTCVLKHKHGHSESVSLQSPPDNSGGKNSIQAIGSTVTYLERYTLRAITGVASKGQDDDGYGATPAAMVTETQARTLSDLLDKCKEKTRNGFIGMYGGPEYVHRSEYDKVLIQLKKAVHRDSSEASDADNQ